jgi:hypothetical protein
MQLMVESPPIPSFTWRLHQAAPHHGLEQVVAEHHQLLLIIADSGDTSGWVSGLVDE